MAATKISRVSNINGTSQNWMDSFQIVEPPKRLPVPNHLLESKIYSKIAQNSVAQARPSVIHFGGFDLNKTQRCTLHIANVSTEVQRMHIIPPQTKYFYIKYTKNERLVPGLTLECTVEFTPDEWRYYYDCIRIHCKGEENLVIPIHAYPVMNTSDFPTIVNFPPVPVGHRKSRIIPLKCHAPIDFEFQLSFQQQHPAFIVEPMSGTVPANGEIDIVVTFAPSEFVTAQMKLQLSISQFNSKPLVCTFTGTSSPGLARELNESSSHKESDGSTTESVLDPRVLSPIDRARRKKKTKKKSTLGSIENRPQEIEHEGIKFPTNLHTPFAVATVLNQQAGKLRVKDLREAILSKNSGDSPNTRQMKEAIFEQAMRQNVYEERQNQLRWQKKIGDDQISPDQRLSISEQRSDAWTAYKLKRGDPLEENEYNRTCTECSFRRTIRDSRNVAPSVAQFDTYSNDMWAARHAALHRFSQAARTLIIRMRGEEKLKYLRNAMAGWKKSNQSLQKRDEDGEELEVRDLKFEMVTLPQDADIKLTVKGVKQTTFPTYVPPNKKDDMAPDALGSVPFEPTCVDIKRKVPYFSLKVPQQYRLMGYKQHNVQEALLNYVPANLVRTLRNGAEDELIQLPMKDLPELEDRDDAPVNEEDMRVESVIDDATIDDAKPTSLAPPEALFQPMEYPPLHIFNQAPGLQVFLAPLPYAEVDPDFHLCPLPRYTSKAPGPHAATQKKYLDREDVIKGVMSWKKFPSQGLTSLSNTPTLTNVWVPRWTDPLGSDMLPTNVPWLLDSLPDDEKENVADTDSREEDGETEDAVTLTPEMVNAQFELINPATAGTLATGGQDKPSSDMFPYGSKMPATNVPVSSTGPVPREKREQELDYFLNKKYNKLGSKMQARVEQINSLKTNPDFILK
ncbi:unnamed protein product [Owenia fusiformis]|uniref:Cep192-like domain-containing protein n=1 Tax=Owenia fusiformis TaxID=6347 RepID=A0A8J1XR15_OWEFU|nr:unnamed protein product [Owenia fusiformis]